MENKIVFLKYDQVNTALNFLRKFGKSINSNYINKNYFLDFFKIKKSSISKCKIILKNNRVIGFRGGFESKFSYSFQKKNYIFKGKENLLWFCLSKNIKENLNLLQEKKSYKFLTSTGFGLTRKFYEKNDLKFINLIRYIKPLNIKEYKKISKKKKFINFKEKEFFSKITALKPQKIKSIELEKIWKKILSEVNILSRFRDRNFWSWRYENCKYYRYIYWKCPSNSGAVVGRVEKILDKKIKKNNLQLLRIIEILPCSNKIWNGKKDITFQNFLKSILKWCDERKFLAVDFYISGNFFDKFLKSAGFFKSTKKNTEFQSFPSIFKPLNYKKRHINITFKINLNNNILNNKKIVRYFVKSDGGGDFPPTDFTKKDIKSLNKINLKYINE